MTRALDRVAGDDLRGIGVDTWGCDYGLVGEAGELLGNPYHYRDTRTDGIVDAVCRRVGRDRIFAQTGSQFIAINTLYQLFAACQATPQLIGAARAVLLTPDLVNYWLTGRMATEYTIASTTQMIDPRTRDWARPLLTELGIPDRLLLPMIEPGSVIGPLRKDVNAALGGTPVVAPACHDTGSAFASVSSEGGVFLSSGTWSLLGAEIAQPVMSSKVRDLNFSNEGGVSGTTRLLKNIGGLWLLQACMRSWAASGDTRTYDEVLSTAADDCLAFRSLFDPDHSAFFHPVDMVAAIVDFCRQTGQAVPASPAAVTRAILESLACKYRWGIESLVALTGARFNHVRIVGGGSRNRLLNQFTADATGLPVIAGPVEATTLGNIAVQMLATGLVPSLQEARDLVERSFPTERFEPKASGRWDAPYRRFQEYLEGARV
jgi:sugar (pentulose or hexulose) kinase